MQVLCPHSALLVYRPSFSFPLCVCVCVCVKARGALSLLELLIVSLSLSFIYAHGVLTMCNNYTLLANEPTAPYITCQSTCSSWCLIAAIASYFTFVDKW
uniref:Uncharacterized protein n=1 Tax=Trypanosoma vivax (strain Y486) TaxID=1055687 RepID=G0U7M4_TRYVY|nr:hypothetical protein TVY486_1009270 [Trypanosoma vivax Y486]